MVPPRQSEQPVVSAKLGTDFRSEGLVRHYRELVQRHGGQFLHHQGGQEGGKKQLPDVVARADVVLCPVDCISHEATLVAKGVCKRATKPFVPLRSSGLSSLQTGLQAWARTTARAS